MLKQLVYPSATAPPEARWEMGKVAHDVEKYLPQNYALIGDWYLPVKVLGRKRKERSAKQVSSSATRS